MTVFLKHLHRTFCGLSGGTRTGFDVLSDHRKVRKWAYRSCVCIYCVHRSEFYAPLNLDQPDPCCCCICTAGSAPQIHTVICCVVVHIHIPSMCQAPVQWALQGSRVTFFSALDMLEDGPLLSRPNSAVIVVL